MSSRRISRRQLLKVAGAAAAAVAAPGLRAPAFAAAPDLNVALLLPSSSRHPALGAEFVAGAERAIADAGRRGRLLRAGLSVGQGDAQAQLDRLLGLGLPTVAIGLLGADAAPALHATLERRRALFIGADMGANIPRHAERSPYVYHVSLGMWQAAYALGAWAARRAQRRVAMATAFYESGYDFPYAFRLGLERGGGTVVDSVVTHRPAATLSLSGALERLAESDPQLVYAAYSGDDAVEFVRAYAASPLGGRVPLAGPGFLTDAAILERQGAAAVGVRSAMAWGAPRLPGRPNLGPIATLGYEAAQLALRLAAMGLPTDDHAALRERVAAVAVQSQRGDLWLDPRSQEAYGRLTLREARATRAGLQTVAVATMPGITLNDPALAELRAAPRTGWLNGYLAV